MSEPTDLNEALRDSAAGPQSVSIDGQSSSEHPLTSQVEAVKFDQATRARRRTGFGVLFAKLKPHGSVE